MAVRRGEWIKLAKILFVTDALVWLVFGGISLVRMGDGSPELKFGLAIILVAKQILFYGRPTQIRGKYSETAE